MTREPQRQPFRARFESRCILCDKTIEPDDWACYTDDDDVTGQVVVHLTCAEDHDV